MDAFKSLAGDTAPVKFKSGSEVIPATVSEIASSFTEKDNYMDFPMKEYTGRLRNCWEDVA